MASNSATASLALLDCSGPIRCSAKPGCCAISGGHLPLASCTRFSPNTRWPAAITGSIASAAKVFDTATKKVVAQWTDNGLVGVTFDEPIDVVALLTASADGPQPRMPRIELSCTAWVREDADIHRTRAVNMSQGGMCIEGSAELRPATEVIVSLAGMKPLRGVVKWKDGDCYGIGFNRVLAISELMSFLQQQQRLAEHRSAA